MNKFVLFSLLVGPLAYAQLEHPLDFEEEYFRKIPYSHWMKDPFKNVLGFSRTPLGASKWPVLSHINTTDIPFAVLDGVSYKEGQYLTEKRFVSLIGDNFVILTEGNFDYELVLPNKRGLAGEEEKPK